MGGLPEGELCDGWDRKQVGERVFGRRGTVGIKTQSLAGGCGEA